MAQAASMHLYGASARSAALPEIIEEAPAAALPTALRARICAATPCQLAARANYHNAGTVEFILAPDGEFYFLEMNTRLQVEHPVTEMICGVDLVEAQLRIAADLGLPWRQDEITAQGHAIECRICCEEPAQDFRPATGSVRTLVLPQGAGVRFDGGIRVGQAITAAFDSMIGKLVCAGADREAAIARALTALGELTVLGVEHNIDYLARVIAHPAFRAGALHTGFVVEHAAALAPPVPDAATRAAIVIAAALGVDEFRRLAYDTPEPHASIGAWRN